MVVLRSKLAGQSYLKVNLRELVREGDELLLERDLGNAVDQFAVKVLTKGGVHIGFVSAKMGSQVKFWKVLESGVRWRCEAVNLTGGGVKSEGLNLILITE